MKVGFIGLGIMGSRMAASLQAQGHDLVVYNRTPQKANALVEQGAVLATSPAEVAQQVDTLVTMLAHPDAVRTTALGEHGILDSLPSGALWIECSTVNPSFAREMASEAAAHDVRFLEAPVAGSKNQAQEAQLIFIAGGEQADVQRAQPLFDAMGQRTVHAGAVGMGISLKLVVNMLLATSMAAFAEGMALGESLGIARETLLNVIIGGPVAAPFLSGKRAKIESGTYDTEFPLRWMQKDLQMVNTAAYESGVAMPVASAARELYQFAVQQGLGDEDFSAVYKFLSELHQ